MVSTFLEPQFAAWGLKGSIFKSTIKSRGSSNHGGNISKGFLQSEVLGEVCVLEGRSLGRSFWLSLGRRGFGEVFGLVLLEHSEKTSANTSAQNSHGSALCTAKLAKLQGKLHDEVKTLKAITAESCGENRLICEENQFV